MGHLPRRTVSFATEGPTARVAAGLGSARLGSARLGCHWHTSIVLSQMRSTQRRQIHRAGRARHAGPDRGPVFSPQWSQRSQRQRKGRGACQAARHGQRNEQSLFLLSSVSSVTSVTSVAKHPLAQYRTLKPRAGRGPDGTPERSPRASPGTAPRSGRYSRAQQGTPPPGTRR